MYIVTKKFRVPVGHRLSKHLGKCQYIHGHNLTIEVSVASDGLNENDMVIDFASLKRIVNTHLVKFDHALLLDENDFINNGEMVCKKITFPCDPTAEVIAKYLFDKLIKDVGSYPTMPFVWKVAVWENEDSKAEYTTFNIGNR
jgi:6-pyruvoyltetrahydropterin/6-carboxytetrahydropterin synthase